MVMAVRQHFPPETITVLDGGNTTLTGVAFHPILSSPSFLYSVKMGYLGTGLPFALGAKLAAPDRPVCLITRRRRLRLPRDGARDRGAREPAGRRGRRGRRRLGHGEDGLSSAQGYGARGLGAARHRPRARSRYDDMARSLGCHGERVERIEDLRPALERAVASRKPAVVHVQVDRELNTKPPGWEQFRKARSVQGY